MSQRDLDPNLLGRFVAAGGTDLLKPNRRVIIQSKIKEVKDRASKDVSRFKIGQVYCVSGNLNEMLIINEIGPHPLDRLPCGYGTLLKYTEDDGSIAVTDEPGYLHLYLLDPRPI